MCVFIFSTSFVTNISHSEKKWARYDQKCKLVFMQSTRYSCQILTVNVFSLGAVRLVWYSLSWLPVLSKVFQTDGQVWLFYSNDHNPVSTQRMIEPIQSVKYLLIFYLVLTRHWMFHIFIQCQILFTFTTVKILVSQYINSTWDFFC